MVVPTRRALLQAPLRRRVQVEEVGEGLVTAGTLPEAGQGSETERRRRRRRRRDRDRSEGERTPRRHHLRHLQHLHQRQRLLQPGRDSPLLLLRHFRGQGTGWTWAKHLARMGRCAAGCGGRAWAAWVVEGGGRWWMVGGVLVVGMWECEDGGECLLGMDGLDGCMGWAEKATALSQSKVKNTHTHARTHNYNLLSLLSLPQGRPPLSAPGSPVLPPARITARVPKTASATGQAWMLDWASRASRQRSGVDRDKVVVLVLGGKRLQGARAPGLLALFGSNWDSQNSAAAALQCDCAFLLVGSDARAAQGWPFVCGGAAAAPLDSAPLGTLGKPRSGSTWKAQSTKVTRSRPSMPPPSHAQAGESQWQSPQQSTSNEHRLNREESRDVVSCPVLSARAAGFGPSREGQQQQLFFVIVCAASRPVLASLVWTVYQRLQLYQPVSHVISAAALGSRRPQTERDRAPASERPSSMQSDPAISFQLSPAAEPIDNGAIGEIHSPRLDLDTLHRSCCNCYVPSH